MTLVWVKSVAATDNYVYRDGEYVAVSGGHSPDGRWTIAAHGGGDAGYDDFHLYLMRAAAGKTEPVVLRTGEHLDTGPLSIAALWSPDSSRVAVLYRSDRRVLDLRLFAVTGENGKLVKIPSLVDVVSRQYSKRGSRQELSGRRYRFTWLKPDRFTLEEFVNFDSEKPIFDPGMEAYLTVNQPGETRTFTSFHGGAMCDITEEGKVRFSDLKPLLDRDEPVVYTPRLRFESGRGLYDTETSMSSLAAQKNRK